MITNNTSFTRKKKGANKPKANGEKKSQNMLYILIHNSFTNKTLDFATFDYSHSII